MLDRWIADWPNTGIGARVTIILLALACLALVTDGAIYNIENKGYLNVAMELPALAFLLLVFVVWPYRLGWAARRRGANFTTWFTCAILFNSVLVGLCYLLRFKWNRVPVAVEADDDKQED